MSKRPRLRRSYVWAALFAVAVVLWIGSGSLSERLAEPGEASSERAAEPAAEAPALFRVRVSTITAEPMPAHLRVTGRTEAVRRVEVRARTAGIVESVPVAEGAAVGEGDLLCQLDDGARAAKLAEERARLASAEIDFQAADKLAQQQFASETRRALAQAELDAARAAVESMEQEIGYTSITAPIDGVLEDREAELGSFLQIGGLCATIVDLDPMLVVVHVGERDIGELSLGMPAQARLVTGQTVQGKVSFIASTSDIATRTFKIEVEVPNPQGRLRDGVTAQVTIDLQSDDAHFLPSSVLTLNDRGQIGVRYVDGGNTVRFAAVKVLSDGRDGVWVSGLPREVDIITVGQDYVLEGQEVVPVPVPREAAQ